MLYFIERIVMNRTQLSYLAVTAVFMILNTLILPAQKVGYISSEEIRKHYLEAKQADQRVQSIVDNWKRQLNQMELEISDLEYEIQKKRLVWSDAERIEKEKELETQKQQRMTFAREKFEEGGEYDRTVTSMYKPVESKIFAAVQEVSADQGYDIVLDKSLHPIAYANPKYDLTIKVLSKLGVDVKELEKQLQEQIDKDPRNQKTQSKEPPKRRSRERKTDDKTIERENETIQPPDEQDKNKTDVPPPPDKDPNGQPMENPMKREEQVNPPKELVF